MDSTINILHLKAEEISIERSKWIDSVIKKNVPSWKLDFLKKFNHPLLKKLLRVDIEIIYETLIAEFGSQTIVKLNGKVIGKMKFRI